MDKKEEELDAITVRIRLQMFAERQATGKTTLYLTYIRISYVQLDTKLSDSYSKQILVCLLR